MLSPKEYNVMGDGNCGPRAIIQNLLLEGFTSIQSKGFVSAFFTGIVERNEHNTQLYRDYHSSSLIIDPIFGCGDPRPPKSDYKDEVYRLPSELRGALKEQLQTFIATYQTMDATSGNLDLLIDKFMPKQRGHAPSHDHLIYMLAAYLRFDMYSVMNASEEIEPIKTFRDKLEIILLAEFSNQQAFDYSN